MLFRSPEEDFAQLGVDLDHRPQTIRGQFEDVRRAAGSGAHDHRPAGQEIDVTRERAGVVHGHHVIGARQDLDLADDESLWEAGDRNRPMYVIVRGEVEILSGADHVVTVHNAGAFTGDVDLLSGRPVVVRARARGAARVLELPPARLRSMIQTDAELSEIFLRAFMLRRLALKIGRAHV